ncbi:MAG: hypothetical protein J1E57_04830 [Prevotella sp.]|nr:hypothetical protein [Prevotella sp.]
MPVQTNELRHWFVLTTLDPLDSEQQIRRENIGRESEGLSAFKFVVPAQLLKRRVSHDLPEDCEDIASNGKDYQNIADPRNRESVRQNNEIRSALRHYLFIFGRESEISCFLDGDWNKFHHNRIQFFYDSERKRPYVSQKTMDEFVRMLADKRLSFELSPALDTLQKGEPIRFRNNAFAGRTAYVVESRRTKDGNVVTVELDLIGNVLRLKVQNVSDSDIIHLDTERTKYAKNNELIKSNQKKLLAILRRRINMKETEQSRMDDMQTLNTIYATRFRSFDDNETTSYRHFIAQILICVCLLHYRDEISAYTAKALAELTEIDKQSESKAATDVRTRLHIALFLATGKPEYRANARAYIRDHQPKSENLKTLVRLISKRQTLKIIRNFH